MKNDENVDLKIRFLFTAPEAPTAIKALVMSAESILVSWRPPVQPNGVISQYTVYTKAEDSETAISQKVPPNQLTHEASGLTETKRYDFWVTASTNIGEGQTSKIVTISPNAKGTQFMTKTYFLMKIRKF